MKHIHRILALLLSLVMVLGIGATAFAADTAQATIDTARTASLTVYKYDITRAEADGVWDRETYVSTGTYDQAVNDVLGDESFTNNSGTNNLAYGYAVKGVEFTTLKIAEIATESRYVEGVYTTSVVYGFDESAAARDFLDALGLTAEDAAYTEEGRTFCRSDVLAGAMAEALAANATSVKNAMENLVKDNGGSPMPETDDHGMSHVEGMPLGLYLVAETRVPDMVTSTCDPFLLSLPMTTVDGNAWNYDVTVYPKNETGMPTLEKTVREAKDDTGKNEGSDAIDDGYAHHATASMGDTLEYQILSTLPSITSEASYLTTYTFEDHLERGLAYRKNDVVIEFFRDSACTDKIATWTEGDGKFTVSYEESDMTIAMTDAGLAEMNGSRAVFSAEDALKSGYSDCVMRITYACTLTDEATVSCGDESNDNQVRLTWKRTNTVHYDILEDDCHVYTYGIDLTKEFSDGQGHFENVKFRIHNDTDNYWLTATLQDGFWYVTGHAETEAEATVFVPDENGILAVTGMEDDAYTFTEIETDEGYTLLKDDVVVVITAGESEETCPVCHEHFLTPSATVNGDEVEMTEAHAAVPFLVVNTPGFELPKTGSLGTWLFTLGGAAAAGLGTVLLLGRRRRGEN